MMISALSGSELSAFRTLRSINQQIAVSKTRLTTGLRLTSPADDPSVWRVSREFRSQAFSLAVLRGDLDRAHVLTARGANGLSNTRDALQAIQLLLARAKSDHVDLPTIQRQLSSVVEDLRKIAQQAAVSGTNILTGSPDILAFPASMATDASRYSITLDKGRTVLFSIGSRDGILETAFDLAALSTVSNAGSALLGLSGTPMANSGADASSAPMNGLIGANVDMTIGVRALNAKSASFRLGSLNAAAFGSGDRLRFELTVNGVLRSVTISLPATTTASSFALALQTAVTRRWAATLCG